MERKNFKYIDEEQVAPIHLAIWNNELLEQKNKGGVSNAKGYYKYDPVTSKHEFVSNMDFNKFYTKSSMNKLEKDHGGTFRFFLAPTLLQMHFVSRKHDIRMHEYQKNSDQDDYYIVNLFDNMPVEDTLYPEDELSLFNLLDLDFDYYHS